MSSWSLRSLNVLLVSEDQLGHKGCVFDQISYT